MGTRISRNVNRETTRIKVPVRIPTRTPPRAPEIPGQLVIPDPVFITDELEEAELDQMDELDQMAIDDNDLDDPQAVDNTVDNEATVPAEPADPADTDNEPIAYRNLAEITPGDLLVRFEAYIYEAKISPMGELQLTMRVPHSEKRRAIGITDYQGFMFLLEVRRRYPKVVAEDSDPSDDDDADPDDSDDT